MSHISVPLQIFPSSQIRFWCTHTVLTHESFVHKFPSSQFEEHPTGGAPPEPVAPFPPLDVPPPLVEVFPPAPLLEDVSLVDVSLPVLPPAPLDPLTDASLVSSVEVSPLDPPLEEASLVDVSPLLALPFVSPLDSPIDVSSLPSVAVSPPIPPLEEASLVDISPLLALPFVSSLDSPTEVSPERSPSLLLLAMDELIDSSVGTEFSVDVSSSDVSPDGVEESPDDESSVLTVSRSVCSSTVGISSPPPSAGDELPDPLLQAKNTTVIAAVAYTRIFIFLLPLSKDRSPFFVDDPAFKK
jgi:hypothetical protein